MPDSFEVMMKALAALACLTVSVFAAAATPTLATDKAQGTWRLADGRVTVRIDSCGSRLCGYVVALAEPLDKKGRPKVDHENPDPALRSRPVMGLQILSNMQAKGDGAWSGIIYNADDGGTYSAYLKLKEGRKMQVKACLGPFCKIKMFLRVN